MENTKKFIDAAGSHMKFSGYAFPQGSPPPMSSNDVAKKTETNRSEQLREGPPAMRTNRTDEIEDISPQGAILKTAGPGSIKSTCNQYARTGKCTFGDKCKYLHVAPASSDRVLRSAEPQVKANKRTQYVNALAAYINDTDGQDANQLFYSFCDDSSEDEGVEQGHTVM
jgi:hypothetical protein